MHGSVVILKVFFKLLEKYLILPIDIKYIFTIHFSFYIGRISKTDKVIWSLLLKIFTNYGLLTDILQCLVIQNSRTAALWVIELCMVVYQNNKKIKINQNDNCMNCKSLNLDTSLVLRTSLNSPHRYTILFLKW